MEIRNDRLKGMSYTELGRKYHIDPRTAKRYAESAVRPEYTLTDPKPTKLDDHKQQVDVWLEEAPYSAVRILEKLTEQGFDGKYSIVKEYVRSKKMDLNEKATVRFETMPGLQGQDVAVVALDNMLAVYHEGKQIAIHRLSYQKRDMVVNAHHYRRLTVKQSFDIENTLLDGDNVIDFPIKPHDLSQYDEAALYE